jgi:hypothetical protein
MANNVNAKEVLAHPALFARVVLGYNLYPWQEDILNECEYILANPELRPNAISLLACNGSGKTSVFVTSLVLWAMSAYKGALVVCTSGAFRQVKEQLFPNLASFQNKFKGWSFNTVEVNAPNGSKALGYSASDEGKAEGFHTKDKVEGPLIYIVDEAKTVADPIFTAVDRCQPTLLIYVSSAGGKIGAFYRSHTSARSNFFTHKITCDDCPHIDEAMKNDIIGKYGIDHPFTRSMLFSEFMGDEADSVISTATLDKCYASGLQQNRDNEVHAFCDFAAGGDENVLAVRYGNKVVIEDTWTDKDTMRACGRFIVNFTRLKLKPSQITGDDGGVGHAIIDRMGELGWAINRQNNGAKPSNDKVWANKGSEVWDRGRKLIEDCNIILPEDEVFKEQLLNRKWVFSSTGKLQLESKEDLKRRGGHSPDRADAVLGAMMPSPAVFNAPIDYTFENYDEHDTGEQLDELAELGIQV